MLTTIARKDRVNDNESFVKVINVGLITRTELRIAYDYRYYEDDIQIQKMYFDDSSLEILRRCFQFLFQSFSMIFREFQG